MHHIRICFINYLSGIIITGGGNSSDTGTSAEVWKNDILFPSSCSTPPLPEYRFGHTQTGLKACGGGGDDRSCVTLSELGWVKSNDLIQPRRHHCAWDTGSGVILLGGYHSPTTTELLKEDGGSEELFPLKYPSR